jgi:hypothetical protein
MMLRLSGVTATPAIRNGSAGSTDGKRLTSDQNSYGRADHLADSHRRQDQCDDRSVEDRTIGNAFEDSAEHAAANHGEQERKRVGEAQVGVEVKRHHRAQHQHLALREIDDLGRSVDDDESQSDESVQAAERQSADDDLSEQFHGPAFGSVRARPLGHHCRKKRADRHRQNGPIPATNVISAYRLCPAFPI